MRAICSFAIAMMWILLHCTFAPAAWVDHAPRDGKPHYYYPVPASDPPLKVDADVCVYGDTPAAVTAAIEASRLGKRVVLVDPSNRIGGMTSGGLSATDGGRAARGISAEFYKAVGQRAGFEPAHAERVLRQMLENAHVQVFYEQRLAAVAKTEATITELATEAGDRFHAREFIDATYEGDLLAAAKVSYTVGREANSQYGETLNGTCKPGGGHSFRFAIDPYIVPGDRASGLLPEISNSAPDAPGVVGGADRHVQAYNFRMFLAKMPDAIEFPKPDDYDPHRYQLLRRYIAAGATKTGDFAQLHPGDSNNQGGFSTDHIGAADRWPEASFQEREKLFQDHLSYQMGLMYFLSHDEGVPERLRQQVSAFGLTKTSFTTTGGWPHELYVREARRMVSDYVLTEKHARGQVLAEDSVALADYGIDSHHCQRFVVRSSDGDRVANEGDVQVSIPRPWPIAYRAMVPKAGECVNLIVPVCLSATHVAYGSLRMEAVFMALGQSAGAAACLAIDDAATVQQVDYAKLRTQLLKDDQMLDWPEKASQR